MEQLFVLAQNLPGDDSVVRIVILLEFLAVDAGVTTPFENGADGGLVALVLRKLEVHLVDDTLDLIPASHPFLQRVGRFGAGTLHKPGD